MLKHSLRHGLTYAVIVALSVVSATAHASAAEFNLGARLGVGGWSVNEHDGSARAQGGGSTFNVQASLVWAQAYAGVGITSGRFDFGADAPRQPTTPLVAQSGVLKRGEFDLVFGYYFWQRHSLFWSLKGATAEWEDGYKLSTDGLGMGATGNYTLTPAWSLLWRAGLMSLTAKHDADKIGNGAGVTLEIGGIYQLEAKTTLNGTLKLQSQDLKFDNGTRQTHGLSTLGVGVNHAF